MSETSPSIPKSATWNFLETDESEVTCCKCGCKMTELCDLLALLVSEQLKFPGIWWCDDCGILCEASGRKQAFRIPLNAKI